MRSKILAAVVLALATVVAVPSLAMAAPRGEAAAHKAKGDEAQFPMPAAAFKQKIDDKLARARTHMEERAAKLDADKAKEKRAKFDAGVAKINAEVAKATADGTVTKEEAKDVFSAMKAMHGGKHAHKDRAQK